MSIVRILSIATKNPRNVQVPMKNMPEKIVITNHCGVRITILEILDNLNKCIKKLTLIKSEYHYSYKIIV